MKKTYGATNKRKGSNAERLYASLFRELGFELCQTARYASKLYDDAKIDLINIPFNIQIKAGIQKGMNPAKELTMMEACIEKMFPKYDSVRTYPKLLIHYKQVGQGKKRTELDSLVYMSLGQFLKFEELTNSELQFLGIRKGRLESNSEFKDIVFVSFDYFVNNVVKKLEYGD